MSIMSWNCQGLGRPQDLTIHRLREMCKKQFPEILFLMETKNCFNVLVDLQVWLGFDRVYTVNPTGLSGGLAVFWKKNVRLEVKKANKNIIDCLAHFGGKSFYLSCIYGDPGSEGKARVWESISRIGCHRKEPWCLIGDFNEILNNSEKMGGPRRSEASFIPFADMLECCEMEEFTSKGNKFTWEGTRWKKRIQCCLDRSFGNKAWLSLFPNSNQTFLEKRGSDHRPVWLNLSAAQSGFKGQFRFDKRLLINPEVKGLIDKVWRRTGSNCNLKVSQKISRCRTVLSRWKRTNQTNAKVKILKLQERMEWFQSKPYPCRFMIEGIHRELVGAYKE